MSGYMAINCLIVYIIVQPLQPLLNALLKIFHKQSLSEVRTIFLILAGPFPMTESVPKKHKSNLALSHSEVVPK